MSNVASIDAARRKEAAAVAFSTSPSIEGARRLDQASWDFADSIVAEVPPEGEGQASPSGIKDGSRQALKLVAEKLARAGYIYSAGTLRQNRMTALVWPEDTRIHEGATFTVHLELRGQDDPPTVLRRLMKKHGGRVTKKQVRAWKQEQNPPAFKSWSDLMLGRLRATAKHAETPEARAEMAALLRQVAQELDDV